VRAENRCHWQNGEQKEQRHQDCGGPEEIPKKPGILIPRSLAMAGTIKFGAFWVSAPI
jgi:hypothetical protein